MSAWKRKALEEFPELRGEIQQSGYSIYWLFMDLLGRLQEAHREGDAEFLKRAYAYAIWAHEHKDYNISNAADVTFFEHLVDSDYVFKEVPKYVPRHVILDCRSIIEPRMSVKKFQELLASFDEIGGRR